MPRRRTRPQQVLRWPTVAKQSVVGPVYHSGGDTGGHMQLEQQLWGGNFFHGRIRTAIEHKVPALCGKPRTKNQLGQFRRLATHNTLTL